MSDIKKINAYNIIWDFAKRYDFKPISYSDKNYYKNIILGLIYHDFDMNMIFSFLSYLKDNNPFFDELKSIIFLYLADISYLIHSKYSLTLNDFKRIYAKKKVDDYKFRSPKNIYQQVENIYYNRFLKKVPKESFMVINFYDELFYKEIFKTNEVIEHLNKIFEKFFKYEKSEHDKSMLDKMIKENKPQNFKEDKEFDDNLIIDQFSIGSAEFTSNIYFEKRKNKKEKNIVFIDDDIKKDSQENYIEEFYGQSYVSKEKIKKLENKICTGIHKNKRLYFSSGKYKDSLNAKFYEKTRKKQVRKNKKYIDDHFQTTNRSINELKQVIKNSIKKDLEENDSLKNFGLLNSNIVWKALYTNDSKVFNSKQKDTGKKFKVTLLLDSSASQHKRQEIVASQAHIIAKSMDLCDIPIRVYTFQTLKDFTIFTKLRDLYEKDKNDGIMNFYASGSNRDGLCFKAIREIIKQDRDQLDDILIILSDGKPHDEKISINTRSNTPNNYTGKKAVEDSAKEIRNLKQDGVSVLGVFTGKDEDVSNAKLIYGSNFCHIKNLENFSKIVSIFMKNEILK
ncbi:MAG: hypothetical protein Q4B52_06800 [Tissierellia bacterium]|nr:hypothetical protein [Tissierellia bacterium]